MRGVGCPLMSYADGADADRFVEDALAGSQPFILKTHGSGALVDDLLISGQLAGVYTWRDPRDAIVSCMRFFDLSFEEFVDIIKGSIERFEQTWKPYCLEVRYPQICPLSEKSVRKFADYLSIPCSPQTAREIADKLSLNATYNITQDPVNFENFRGIYKGRKISNNFWHEGHVQHGGHGLWRVALNSDQISRIESAMPAYYLARADVSTIKHG